MSSNEHQSLAKSFGLDSGTETVDWMKKVNNLNADTFSEDMKSKIKLKLESYLKQMRKN